MQEPSNKTNIELETEIIPATDGISDYELLADLFIYPNSEFYKDKITDIYGYLLKTTPEAAEAMAQFMEFLESATLKDMQELYLRSFDVQAITTLDIGFILFGEDYKRGQLLVHLNQEHREAGNICHTELSDHLPNVLRLLPKMKDEIMRNEIATRLVIPAIVKMTREFTPEKIQKKDEIYKKHQKTILDFSEKYRSVYFTLLQALLVSMKKDFGYDPAAVDNIRVTGCEETSSCSVPPDQSESEIRIGSTGEMDYNRNIENELTIEKEK